MEKIIFNGSIYIKKAPRVKTITKLVKGTFNIDDIRTGESYTVEKPDDLKKFSDFVIKIAEDSNLIERQEKTIYDNTDFYQIYIDINGFYVVNKSSNTIDRYASIDKLEQEYICLEDFLNRALYIGRELTNGREILELIYTYENIYLLRNPLNGMYIVLDRNNPELKGYTLGSILPIYYTKDEVYKEINKQGIKLNSDNNEPKR